MKLITFSTILLFFLLLTLNLVTSIIVTTTHVATSSQISVEQPSANFQALQEFDCSIEDYESSISYQLHSWNDLREWHQTLRKGGYWFKIDPHWMNQSYCETQEAFIGKNTDNGCFVLNHDTPLTDISYNTTYQLLELIKSDSISPFFQKQTKIHIALCFKVDDFNPCDGSEFATMWNTLVDELFQDYQSFIEETGYNLEFILDGASTPGAGRDCLNQKWRPWNATYIIDSDGLGPLFSNNALNGSDRFQIMNTPTNFPTALEYLTEEASYSYGKFLGGNYPFLNWEPSEQDIILNVVDYYLDQGMINEAGFRFAINIDQVVFQVYTGSRTGNAWNECLSPDKAINPSILSISTFPTTLFPNIAGYLLTTYTTNDLRSNTRQYVISLINDQVLGEVSNSSPQLLPSGSSISILSSSLSSIPVDSSHSLVFHLFVDSSFDILSLDFTTSILTLDNSGVIFPGESNSFVTGKLFVNNANSTTNFVIASKTSQCGVEIQSFNLNTSSYEFIPSAPSFCAVPSTLAVNGISIDLIEVTSEMTNINCVVGDVIGFVSYSDTESNVYFFSFCMNEITASITVFGRNEPIDVGQNPSVSIALVKNEVYAMAVHEHGYCWNSHWRNIRSGPKICDDRPHSIPYILNYNYGTIDSWIEHSVNSKILSPCDDTIFHGVYDSGSSPSVTLYLSPSGEVGVAEVHEGVPSLVVSVEAIECGLASHSPGLILDSWDLDPLASIP